MALEPVTNSANGQPTSTHLGSTIMGLMKDRGMTISELSQGSGVSKPFLYKIVDCTRRASDDIIARLAKALGVQAEVLMAARKLDVIGGLEGVAQIQRHIPGAMLIAPVEVEYIKMPYAGKVGCGRPIAEAPLEHREVPKHLAFPGAVTLEACGNSMSRAGILHGDSLVIRRQDHANEGQIVIASLAHEGAVCKRYGIIAGRPALLSEAYNPGDEDEPRLLEEGDAILGVVCSVHKERVFPN